MLKKNKELKMMTFFALGLSVVGIVFACIAMNVSLTTKAEKSVWNVKFADLNVFTNGTATAAGQAQLNSTSLSNTSIVLMRKNDSVSYKFRIRNSGTIDAEIKFLSKIRPTCVVTEMNSSTDACNSVDYTLTYSDGTAVNVGDIISSGTSKEVVLKVEYLGNAITEMEITDLDLALVAEQA